MSPVLDLLDLLQGVAKQVGIMSVVVLVYTYTQGPAFVRSSWLRQAAIGTLFGIGAIAGMMMALRIMPGVMLDLRTSMILLSIAFGGPLSGAIVASEVAFFRYLAGSGLGWLPGSLSPFVTLMIGYAVAKSIRDRGWSFGARQLALLAAFGAVVTVSSLFVFLSFSSPEAAVSIMRIAAPAIGASTFAGTFIVGLLLRREEKRWEAEQELEKSRRGLLTMSEQSPGVIYRRIMGADGSLRYEFSPKSLERLLKVPAEAGSLENDLGLVVHPDDRERVQRSVADSARTLEAWDQTFRTVPGTVGAQWLRGVSRPSIAENGEICWDGFLVDVTREKETEAALQEAQEELRALARQDPLTGLANRRHFDEVIQNELTRGARNGRPTSLLMIDADHFKSFNDLYGHQAGDECLQAIAATIREAAIRSTDLPVRYGGEEFALLLPETDEAGAREIANRILRDIRDKGILHERIRAGKVTVSIGCATARGQVRLPSDLIRAADEALYEAKGAGRDQVCVGSPTVHFLRASG